MDNPVLRKELMRYRLKVAKPVKLATVLVVILIFLLLYIEIGLSLHNSSNQGSDASDLCNLLLWLQFLGVLIFAPGIMCSSIAQEREQQTLDMLLYSPLKTEEIVFGKITARIIAVSFLLLLIAPLILICALIAMNRGSLHLFNVMNAYITTFITVFFALTISLFYSWRLKRTLYALIATYSTVIGLLIIADSMVSVALSIIAGSGNGSSPLLWINPVMLFNQALSPDLAHPQSAIFQLLGLAFYLVCSFILIWTVIRGLKRNRTNTA